MAIWFSGGIPGRWVFDHLCSWIPLSVSLSLSESVSLSLSLSLSVWLCLLACASVSDVLINLSICDFLPGVWPGCLCVCLCLEWVSVSLCVTL